MSDQVPDSKKTITREELYNLLWTRPLMRLTKELGYSYPDLVAICTDLNIPRPSGGYWHRLKHGVAENQVPLPPAPAGRAIEISFGQRRTSTAPIAVVPLMQKPSNEAESAAVTALEKVVAAASEATEKSGTVTGVSGMANRGEQISVAAPAPTGPVRITREELYRRVWKTTLKDLALELGTTYVELVRVCDELDVPRPYPGYWPRLRDNLGVEVQDLPAHRPGLATEGLLQPKRASRKSTPEATEVTGAETEAAEPPKEDPTSSEVAACEVRETHVDALAQVDYTREELYQAIWSTPGTKLAAKLGLSDVALAKTCRRMGVPRPPPGYWARIEAGEKVRREPLPLIKPGQRAEVQFDVASNIARRQEWAATNVLTTGKSGKPGLIELAPEGTELHPIAEKHRIALGKAKSDALGFVTIRAKNLFWCNVSSALVPKLIRALHAVICELEDRDYVIAPGENEYQGLQITKGTDRAHLEFSEAKVEIEREPTAADKRKPSWTWQLKETKATGELSIQVGAPTLRGKRRWTESDGRPLEQLLGCVVEKVEAAFRGFEDLRKREEEWARQREEQAKHRAQEAAIEAEKVAQEEKKRKEREKINRHETKLHDISEARSANLAIAAQQWIEACGVFAFIDSCEDRWRAGGSELSKEQFDWIKWAKAEAAKRLPLAKGYPAPATDGKLDATSIPMGGPYPEVRELEEVEAAEPQTQTPEPKPHELEHYRPPEQFPFWLMHRKH